MQQAWTEHFADLRQLPVDYVPLPACEILDSFDHLNTENLLLANGVTVRVEKIPPGMFGKVELFYVCANCGKVYWEGGHYDRVHKKFSYLLSKNDQ